MASWIGSVDEFVPSMYIHVRYLIGLLLEPISPEMQGLPTFLLFSSRRCCCRALHRLPRFDRPIDPSLASPALSRLRRSLHRYPSRPLVRPHLLKSGFALRTVHAVTSYSIAWTHYSPRLPRLLRYYIDSLGPSRLAQTRYPSVELCLLCPALSFPRPILFDLPSSSE